MPLAYTMEVDTDGTRRWINSEDQLHREDGPAIIYADGILAWYRHDQLHREDGPAIIYADGNRFWYKNGVPHRTDGPAVLLANGECAYWVDGELLTPAEFASYNAQELTVAEVEALLGHQVKIKS